MGIEGEGKGEQWQSAACVAAAAGRASAIYTIHCQGWSSCACLIHILHQRVFRIELVSSRNLKSKTLLTTSDHCDQAEVIGTEAGLLCNSSTCRYNSSSHLHWCVTLIVIFQHKNSFCQWLFFAAKCVVAEFRYYILDKCSLFEVNVPGV